MVTKVSQAASSSVVIIADSRETIDGLQQYFQGAGIASTTTRVLRDAPSVSHAATTMVLFPDEFPAEDVTSGISSLRKKRPKLLIVVVTNAPQRIASALQPERDSVIPVVLLKPVFGWTILDSIREHVHSETRDG